MGPGLEPVEGFDQRPVRLALRGGQPVRVDLPFADLEPFVGKPPPGTRIGLVILVGDNDRIARLHPLPEGLG